MVGLVGALAFVVGAGVAWLVARRTRVPYPIVLVAWGLAMREVAERFAAFAPPVRLSPHLLLDLLLPPLLFEGAHALRAADVRRSAPLIALLAGPGVVLGGALAMVLTWAALHLVGAREDAWLAALLFAAVTSATDPIAVLAVLRSARAAPSLRVVLDAESLLNDAMAVVVVGIVVSVAGGESPRWGSVLVGAAWHTIAGLAIGAAIGWVASTLASFVSRALGAYAVLPTALSMCAAYGAHVAATRLGASSLFAVIAAGFVWGQRYGAPEAAVKRFWRTGATAINALTFLLVGLELDPARLGRRPLMVLFAWGALLLARAAFVGVFTHVTGEASRHPGGRRVLVLGGIRGALAIVLAQRLPPSTAREVVIDLTLGVVCLTLAQGLVIAYGRRRGAATSR